MKDNVILDKTMDFSVRIVKLYKYLCTEKNEYIMSKQLLRSGTSIGANAHEAHNGQSDKDFLAKMYIAFKEASETEYWLKLLLKTEYLTIDQSESILEDCVELKKILTAIIKTLKSNVNGGKQK
ncbi:MAG: four helix bundle protein [Oscillospiraceae bacterium]|nr:four helix bundle protein [Oscillospiraceae bacterium]